MDYTDKKIEDALMTQRDTAVEALVFAYEKRAGWEAKVEAALKTMPTSLLCCFKR